MWLFVDVEYSRSFCDYGCMDSVDMILFEYKVDWIRNFK